MKYQDTFQSIGLSKNEAQIFEALLTYGEIGVGDISKKTRVHRRNVYDCLNRLVEKGLATEIVESYENKYTACEPKKLAEIQKAKLSEIEKILPDLEALHFDDEGDIKVKLYRGKEGWKQYMREILKVGEVFYSIGAQGAWLDPSTADFFPGFIKEIKKRNIKMMHLFDPKVKELRHEILNHVGKDYKFMPKKYATTSGMDVFGNHVAIMPYRSLGKIGKGSDISFTVITNKNLANSLRTWFQFMWDSCTKN